MQVLKPSTDFIRTQMLLSLRCDSSFQIFTCVVLKLSGFLFLIKILWAFSIYLEAVAILPQLYMISKTGEAETITAHYLFALGSYRALYIINWIYRYVNEDTYELIAIVAGTVQTILYVDFFYLYVTRGTFLACPSNRFLLILLNEVL